DMLASNPHADSFGNADVWYFRDLARKGIDAPPDAGLAQWFELLKRESASAEEVRIAAEKIQHELVEMKGASPLYPDFVAPHGAFWAPLRDEMKVFSPTAVGQLPKLRRELVELRNNPPPPIAQAHCLQE